MAPGATGCAMVWKFLKKKRFWGVVIAFGFLVYSFWGIDLAGAWDALRKVEPIYFIPVLLGMFLMPLTRSERLKTIFEKEKQINSWKVYSAYNIAQLLNMSLPMLTGQVARGLFFSKSFGLTKTYCFTMIVLEALFDGLTLLMFVFASSSLMVFPGWLFRGEVVVLVACLLLFGFFYFALHRQGKSSGRVPRWMFRILPRRWIRKWLNMSSSFLAGIRMLRSGRHLVKVVLLSLASWLAHALAVFSLLFAFGFDLPFWGALVILIINTAVIMVPISPGNLGTFQFACIFGLSFFGIPKESALSFSLVLQVLENLPVVILGTYFLLTSHTNLKEYQTDDLDRAQDILTGRKSSFNGGHTVQGPECAKEPVANAQSNT